VPMRHDRAVSGLCSAGDVLPGGPQDAARYDEAGGATERCVRAACGDVVVVGHPLAGRFILNEGFGMVKRFSANTSSISNNHPRCSCAKVYMSERTLP
jgi:hypothetical protein